MGVTPSPLNFINQRKKNIMKDRRGKKERNIYIKHMFGCFYVYISTRL